MGAAKTEHPKEEFEHKPEEVALVEEIRALGRQYRCRIEICSHDEKRPVSASNGDGTLYGFGKSPGEASAELWERERRRKAATA